MGQVDTKSETPEPRKWAVAGHWRILRQKDGSTKKVWVDPHIKRKADQ